MRHATTILEPLEDDKMSNESKVNAKKIVEFTETLYTKHTDIDFNQMLGELKIV